MLTARERNEDTLALELWLGDCLSSERRLGGERLLWRLEHGIAHIYGLSGYQNVS